MAKLDSKRRAIMVARTARKYRPPSPHIRKTLTPKKLKTPVEVKKMVIPSYQQPVIFSVKPEVTLEKLAKRTRGKAIHSAPAVQAPNLDLDGDPTLPVEVDLLYQAVSSSKHYQAAGELCKDTSSETLTEVDLEMEQSLEQTCNEKLDQKLEDYPEIMAVLNAKIVDSTDNLVETEEDLEMEQTFEEACKEAGLEPVDNSPIPGIPVGSMIMAAIMGAGVASYPMIEKGVSGAGIAKAVGAGIVSAGLELLIESKVDAVSNNTAARYTCASVVGSAIGGGVIGIEKVLESRRNTPTPISYPMSEQPITDE